MITINWSTKIINIPQSYLNDLGGGIYELDTDQLRLDLKDMEDSEEGMAFPTTHNHFTTITVGGVTLARVIEIINGYTITFENGMYAVNLVGSNNNISDVANVNSVSIRSANSAGLIQVNTGGGGLSADDVWNKVLESGYTAKQLMRLFASVLNGRISGAATGTEVFRDINNTKDRVIATVDENGNRTGLTLDAN